MNAKFTYYTKKSHRYLGVFIGIQFLLWTIGGLYFSWTNITEIRGEHLRSEPARLAGSEDLISPSVALEKISSEGAVASPERLQLITVLGKPFYEIVFETADGQKVTALADARSGSRRAGLTEKEAVEVATRALLKPSETAGVALLTKDDVGGHHEYRDKPLPAYAVTFNKPADLTVYVARDTGRVESFRTNQWRVFDFFWMVHTLDLNTRDDINNYLLRAFSVLGLVTLFSGYLLFFITSPWIRNGRTKGS